MGFLFIKSGFTHTHKVEKGGERRRTKEGSESSLLHNKHEPNPNPTPPHMHTNYEAGQAKKSPLGVQMLTQLREVFLLKHWKKYHTIRNFIINKLEVFVVFQNVIL